MKLCKIKKCKKEFCAKGYCNTHYKQLYRTGKILEYEYFHKMQGTHFYYCWAGMKDRATNPKAEHHKNYYDKGITIYDKWKIFEFFKKDMYKSFLKHVKKYGERNTTIERIDNKKGYYPENCRWATYQEQWLNKDNSRIIEFNGKKDTLSSWARKLKISQRSLDYRLKNWDFNKAMTIPALDNRTRHTIKYK